MTTRTFNIKLCLIVLAAAASVACHRNAPAPNSPNVGLTAPAAEGERHDEMFTQAPVDRDVVEYSFGYADEGGETEESQYQEHQPAASFTMYVSDDSHVTKR